MPMQLNYTNIIAYSLFDRVNVNTLITDNFLNSKSHTISTDGLNVTIFKGLCTELERLPIPWEKRLSGHLNVNFIPSWVLQKGGGDPQRMA